LQMAALCGIRGLGAYFQAADIHVLSLDQHRERVFQIIAVAFLVNAVCQRVRLAVVALAPP
jgi:hypothetical protein